MSFFHVLGTLVAMLARNPELSSITGIPSKIFEINRNLANENKFDC